MYSTTPAILVKWLRAAGESSRLRLLALCGDAVLSVSDLAHALRQSEPRVSRHLKILCEAGLIERLRQGQWVHYRVAANVEAASFVRGLLAQLDRHDPLLQGDRVGVRAAVAPGARGAGTESRLGRTLAQLLASGGFASRGGPVLLVGVEHPELLECAARAGDCTAIAHSRRAAQGARAHAERRGFACRILPASSREGLSDAELHRAGSSFDAIVLDHPAAAADVLERVLAQARRALAPGGRLWIFQGYDSLESSRERVVEHPLARLRRLLAAAGLTCERITPVEADGAHVLAALARVEVAPPVRMAQQGGADR